MDCCEHGNEQLGSQNEGNSFTSWRNISSLRSTPHNTVSQLLTAQQAVYPHSAPHSQSVAHCTTSSLSTHNQLYYRITNSNHSVSSTNTTQCPLYFPLYTVCLYSERLLNCTFCSVFCQFQQQQETVLLCKLTGEIWGYHEEYRLVRCDVTAVWHCAAGGCLCRIVLEYPSAITRTFAINSVIVVAISHTLSAIYLNSNESSGGTSGCNRGTLHKIHNFPWSHTSTKDTYIVVIGK